MDVSPHVINSSRASWINMYCACVERVGVKVTVPSTLIRAHLCLHHQHSLGAHVPHKLVHIQVASLLHAFQHGVQCDVGASPAHTSTTVHQDGPVTGIAVAHTSNKLNQGGSKLGNTVIRPAQEMELSH